MYITNKIRYNYDRHLSNLKTLAQKFLKPEENSVQ